MTEKEGELYRIIPLATQVILKAKSQVHSETLKLENAHDPLDNVRRIGEILDEAAQEYPQFNLPHKPERFVADVFIKLLLERDNWFKKWFGEPQK